jgi:hypothetical protein
LENHFPELRRVIYNFSAFYANGIKKLIKYNQIKHIAHMLDNQDSCQLGNWLVLGYWSVESAWVQFLLLGGSIFIRWSHVLVASVEVSAVRSNEVSTEFSKED